jgi:TRAP-type C4-dicarboxylate transport system permease small subunit
LNEKKSNITGLIKASINMSEKSIEILLVLFSVAIVVLVFFQVVFRYVFFFAISWSEELATFLFVWIVLLGAAVGFRKQSHLGINILTSRLPDRVARVLAIVTNLAVIFFFGVVLFYGWQVAMGNMARRAYTLDVSVGYIRMALPLMALFSVIFLIEWGIKLIRDLLNKR